MENAESALQALQFKITQPLLYKDRRAAAVRYFQIFEGEAPPPPDWPIVKRTAAQIKADKSLRWKALCRKARGYAGLCLERLDKAKAALSTADSTAARESYEAADKSEHYASSLSFSLASAALTRPRAAFREAFDLDPADRTPMRELEQLEREMMAQLGSARLLQHARHKPAETVPSSTTPETTI